VTPVIAMEDAGFILTSYVVTFAAIGVYAWAILRGARRRAKYVKREDLPWT
jgi:hypothetical protein